MRMADEGNIEHQKLAIDQRRLSLEERKAKAELRWGWLTRLVVLIPVVVALIAFMQALKVQNEKAKDDFEVKAAEIVMNADTPAETDGRARALAALFPDRLGPDFASQFDPDKFANRPQFERDQVVAAKKELLDLVAAHPQDRALIIELWRDLFPDDAWVEQIPQ
jgi:flagellar biosynthesis/type III secretory pathway M-ring protein FliF/YscJ